ncbi:hypothetical protein LIER_39376 [Lithospermum erythrorhizon]|uniref:Uncharacterized protein n=1 Tax=Lithospermum erythrorhizon TaxID=34254 RepID=A0AAV3QGW4_LITER
MRVDTIEVLLCGGDWIKEAYDIRSDKHVNDPDELRFFKEYNLLDKNSMPQLKLFLQNKKISRPIKAAQTSKDVHT